MLEGTYMNARGEVVIPFDVFRALDAHAVCASHHTPYRYWPRRFARLHSGSVTREQLAARGIVGDKLTLGHALSPEQR